MNHARRTWRVPASLIIYLHLPRATIQKETGNDCYVLVLNTFSHGRGAGAGAGAGRTYGPAMSQGYSRAAAAMRKRGPELGERSARASQVRMQCECSLGNCACECPTAINGDIVRYQTARKGKKTVVLGPDSDMFDNISNIAIPPIALWAITLNEGSRVQMDYRSH
eukprot:6177447-Pleurochrysis_carterae.AAC.2